MPSRVRCSWKRGRMVGRRNRSRSTRNRPVTGECITTGQRLGNQAGSSLLSCCSMILRSPRSKRTCRRATCERSDATRKGPREVPVQLPQMVQPCTWFKHARHSSEHAVLPNPSIEGDVQGLALCRPSCQTLNIMRGSGDRRKYRLNYQR